MPDPPAPSRFAELERLAARAVRAAASSLREDGRVERALALLRAPLLAEEPGSAVVVGFDRLPAAQLVWVVEPFAPAKRRPPEAVAVAAVLDGVVVAAAVVATNRQEECSAHLGGGSRTAEEPLRASGCALLAAAIVVTGPGLSSTRSLAAAGRVDVVAFAAGEPVAPVPALQFCRVASGEVDGYVDRGFAGTQTLAGALVAEEAGAVLELPCPENDGLLLVAAPGIYEPLRASLD